VATAAAPAAGAAKANAEAAAGPASTPAAAGPGAATAGTGTAASGAAAGITSTAAGAAAPAGTAAAPIPAPDADSRPAAGEPTVIAIDTADYDPSSQLTLAQAAKAERERKAEAEPPRIVITNKNLHRYAKGGQLTVADAKKKKGAAAGGAAGAGTGTAGATAIAAGGSRTVAAGGADKGRAAAAAIERDESWWRGRALDIRERWRKAAERVKGLEQDVSDWRRRFYAQDDPWVRDGQIKPAWDHALEELRASRAAVEAAKKELADFLEEGRVAGALPGWLREGIDLEPKEEPPADPTQAIETPIYKEPGR
jgi:hypothetical protein